MGGVVLFNLMEGVTYVKVREIVYEAGFENGEWLKKKKKKRERDLKLWQNKIGSSFETSSCDEVMKFLMPY